MAECSWRQSTRRLALRLCSPTTRCSDACGAPRVARACSAARSWASQSSPATSTRAIFVFMTAAAAADADPGWSGSPAGARASKSSCSTRNGSGLAPSVAERAAAWRFCSFLDGGWKALRSFPRHASSAALGSQWQRSCAPQPVQSTRHFNATDSSARQAAATGSGGSATRQPSSSACAGGARACGEG